MAETDITSGDTVSARLPDEEEKTLWEAVQEGDDSARERLILAYRPLVFWMAKRYFHTDPSRYGDLIQEGMVALIVAVDRFDPSRKFRFSTFAFYRVRGRMSNFLQRSERKAPIPVGHDIIVRQEGGDAEMLEWMLSIQEGLQHLPDRETEILKALVLEGRKAREVALDRGVDVSHIYKIRKRAIGRLRDLVGLNGPLFGGKRG